MDERLLNPFGVDPAEEYMHAPQPIPNWTEYCYFYGGDAQSAYGVSIHAGRDCEDPRTMRGTVAIFLPDDEILIASCMGPDTDKYGFSVGPLKVRCIEPMRLWLAEFDGLVHRVKRGDIARAVPGDAPTEVARFRILFEAASPLWDLDRAGIARSMVLVAGDVSAQQAQAHRSHHWQQVGRSRGEIVVGGVAHAIAGAAMRDHTYGPRDYGALVGSRWFNGLFPDGSCFMLMATRVGENFIRGGFLFRNDGSPLEVVSLLEHPVVGAVDTPDGAFCADLLEEDASRRCTLVVGTRAGNETIAVEMTHGMPVTLISPAQEILGTALTRATGCYQMTDGPTRLRWRGMEGAGMTERIARIRHLGA